MNFRILDDIPEEVLQELYGEDNYPENDNPIRRGYPVSILHVEEY